MPHFTLPWTIEGLELRVMIGLTGHDATALATAGRPIPRPVLLQGVIDTASTITVVSASVLSPFNLTPKTGHSTHGVAGSLSVRLFEVSLSIPPVGSLQAPLLVLPSLLVMEWVSPAPGVDCLVGRDVLAQLLALVDGPRKEFTLGD